MWNLLGLVGLLSSAIAVLGLAATAVVRRSPNWPAAIALAGLLAFVGSLAGEAFAVGGVHQRATTSPLAATAREPFAEHSGGREIVCGQLSPNRAASSTYRDGALIYSLFWPRMYLGSVTVSRDRAGWVEIELFNASDAEAVSRPWTDLWLTWRSVRTGTVFSGQPTRVDVVDMAGPTPVPARAAVSVAPRTACLLLLTFLMQAEAEQATLGVGYIGAFNIDLRPVNVGSGR